MKVEASRFPCYLPPELYLGIVKLQADRGLGRIYPVLLAITEGLYQMGYISKEVYEIYSKKYSEKLIKEEVKPLTPKRRVRNTETNCKFQKHRKKLERSKR